MPFTLVTVAIISSFVKQDITVGALQLQGRIISIYYMYKLILLNLMVHWDGCPVKNSATHYIGSFYKHTIQ